MGSICTQALVAASVFRTDKTNARETLTDGSVENSGNQRVNGFQIQTNGLSDQAVGATGQLCVPGWKSNRNIYRSSCWIALFIGSSIGERAEKFVQYVEQLRIAVETDHRWWS